MTRPGRIEVRFGFLLIILLLVIASCGSSRGVFHTVRKGETLWRISYTYGVDIQDVAEVNNIRNPAKIRRGQRIFIPGATRIKRVAPAGSKSYAKKSTVKRKRVKIEKGRFVWPVKGRVVEKFGVKDGTSHNGIDIKASRGTPIKASEAGTVVHTETAASFYGNFIIIKHGGDFFTLYAHNDKNVAKRGQSVKKGAVIGMVGSSGDAPMNMLHFEIRDGKKVRNPLFLLP